MKLIYYRDGEGNIKRYHLPPPQMSEEELTAAIEAFNAKGEKKAFCAEIEENSLEMFLFEKARWQKRFPKLMIEEALEALSEARDAIQMLEADEETGGVDNA